MLSLASSSRLAVLWRHAPRRAAAAGFATPVLSDAAVASSNVSSVQIAKIATATLPCLHKKIKWQKVRVKQGKRKKKDEEEPAVKETRSEKIARMKFENELLKAGKTIEAKIPPPKLAPTVKPGPSVCLTKEEALEERTKLNSIIVEEVQKLSDVRKQRIQKWNEIIKKGKGVTPYELRQAVYAAAAKNAHSAGALKGLKKVLENSYIHSPDFMLYVSPQIAKLSDDLQREINIERESILRQGYTHKMRLEQVLLEEIPLYKKTEFLNRKRELLFKEEPPATTTGIGTSMLPTLKPGSRGHHVPVVESEIQIDDLVGTIITRNDGSAVRALKRVAALEDAIVDFRGGKAIVPKDHCWILGDNPDHSYDSRHFGAVPLSNLRAKLVRVEDAPTTFSGVKKIFFGWVRSK